MLNRSAQIMAGGKSSSDSHSLTGGASQHFGDSSAQIDVVQLSRPLPAAVATRQEPDLPVAPHQSLAADCEAGTPKLRTGSGAGFSSGVASLDDWLRRCARTNQVSGVSRTSVLAEDTRVATMSIGAQIRAPTQPRCRSGSFTSHDPGVVIMCKRLDLIRQFGSTRWGHRLTRVAVRSEAKRRHTG